MVAALFDLDLVDRDVYRGVNRGGTALPVFGGQLLGQALAAASATVESDRLVNSLHSYFLRPGDSAGGLLFAVDRLRDGYAFSTRRVDVLQNDVSVFTMTASFHRADHGLEHGLEAPVAPDPESLPTLYERYAGYESQIPWFGLPQPVELRYVDDPPWIQRGKGPRAPVGRVWLRLKDKLPDDPVLHTCALAFASDMTLLEPALVAHATSWDGLRFASLDHSLWFHRSLRADEWLLYETTSPSAAGARGLGTGRFWDRAGRLVASSAQEGLLRIRSEVPA